MARGLCCACRDNGVAQASRLHIRPKLGTAQSQKRIDEHTVEIRRRSVSLSLSPSYEVISQLAQALH